MTGRVSEKLELNKNGMPFQCVVLHRGLGLLRVCIVLLVLNWVMWLGIKSMFLPTSVNTGPFSLIMFASCLYSVLAILTLMLLSIAMRRCTRSSGLSARTLSVLLLRIVLLIWMFWTLFHFFQNVAGFVVDIQLLLSEFQQKYAQYIFPPYAGHVLRLLFVLSSIALAQSVNARFGNRLSGVREFRLVAACGMLVCLADWGVVIIIKLNLYWGNFLMSYWLYEIGILLLKGFGVFWIWRALGMAQRRLNAELPCRNCNYNLTGNISGTCPECGTTISNEAPAGPDPSPVSPAGAS